MLAMAPLFLKRMIQTLYSDLLGDVSDDCYQEDDKDE